MKQHQDKQMIEKNILTRKSTVKDIFKPTRCKECDIALEYIAFGMYQCPNCKNIEYDEYGKIRYYLEEHGPRPAIEISRATGIPVSAINEYLREGRLEIPDGSPVYISCELCGTDIRFGRFCPACAANLSKKFQTALMPSEVGEIPKNGAKMHFLNKDKDENDRRKEKKLALEKSQKKKNG